MASTYLTKSASAGNRKTFTFNAWVKLAGLGTARYLLTSYNGASDAGFTYLAITDGDKIKFAGYGTTYLETTQVLRDTSAYYMLTLSVDTTSATANNRCRMYLNGTEITSFGTRNNPSQNTDLAYNQNSVDLVLGSNNYGGSKGAYFNGSMSHVHFIDGLAYDADTFGNSDPTTGIWVAKTSPSVTYSGNSFFLKGENSGALGTDSSGLGNDFVINGTPTQTVDTPSNVFATGNPLYRWSYNQTQTNGNTSFAGTQNQWQGASSTLGISKGKYYFEAKITNDNGLSNGSTAMMIGFMGLDDYILSNPSKNFVGHYSYDGGEIFVANTTGNTATTADYGTFATNDIMGVALDYDNELISIYKNGSAIVTNFDYGAVATSDTLKDGKTITPVFVSYGTNAVSANFGNGYFGTTAVASAGTSTSGDDSIWEYNCPDGYYGLNTKNINEQEYS